MPHLFNFANEILIQIIAATSPHDIESFAASCRTIHSLAEFKLKRHHELKRKYANLEFRDSGYSDNTPGVHPIYVLRDVLHDTAVAQYPTVLRSTPLYDSYYNELDNDRAVAESEDVQAVAVGCESEIKDAIYQCPFIKIPDRDTWKAQIMQGNGEAILGLLLTLLPHLTSMAIEQRPEGLLTQMFKRIIKLQKATHGHAPQALTKLSGIDTTPYYSEDDMDTVSANEFDYLSQYMLLPSMRTITGSHFRIEVGGHPQIFQWRHNPGISAVTEITINRSSASGQSITNLLRGIRALEKFSFSFGGYVPIYQPRKMINGLQQHAKCSLSYLHLTNVRLGTIAMQIDDPDTTCGGLRSSSNFTLTTQCSATMTGHAWLHQAGSGFEPVTAGRNAW